MLSAPSALCSLLSVVLTLDALCSPLSLPIELPTANDSRRSLLVALPSHRTFGGQRLSTLSARRSPFPSNVRRPKTLPLALPCPKSALRNRWIPVYVKDKFWAGLHSVAFSRLVVWFTKYFEFIKDQFALPSVMLPALGGLGAGMIALKYPGILYWGFTNVEEILHTGKSASAPGIWLLTQLVCAKVVATAICKGSGLVGGLYAPSLMIGAALGAVFGGSAAELINSAIPGNGAVAQPQAYALVGMAATLASVCSVPLTSVLLLFELTKDYRILLPLMVTNGFVLTKILAMGY
ncbi:chloride channel protein CLC-f-like, partial [Zingiber officinale]|uniref:chloride channel protein CLC-f-like n=1 Tax=Zingiber officinale TaxID=94328 RepID=UPI001C4BA750